MTAAQWAAIYAYAEAVKAQAGDFPITNGIIGRSMAGMVHVLVLFWGRHKATILRYLSVAAISTLEALVANEAEIARINPPGPA